MTLGRLKTKGNGLGIKKELPKKLPTRVLEKNSQLPKLLVGMDLRKLERAK